MIPKNVQDTIKITCHTKNQKNLNLNQKKIINKSQQGDNTDFAISDRILKHPSEKYSNKQLLTYLKQIFKNSEQKQKIQGRLKWKLRTEKQNHSDWGVCVRVCINETNIASLLTGDMKNS